MGIAPPGTQSPHFSGANPRISDPKTLRPSPQGTKVPVKSSGLGRLFHKRPGDPQNWHLSTRWRYDQANGTVPQIEESSGSEDPHSEPALPGGSLEELPGGAPRTNDRNKIVGSPHTSTHPRQRMLQKHTVRRLSQPPYLPRRPHLADAGRRLAARQAHTNSWRVLRR